MRLGTEEMLNTRKQQKKLRERRAFMLFWTSYLVCFVIFTVALIVVAQLKGFGMIDNWIFGDIFGSAFVAGAIAAVYYTFSTWQYQEKEED